MPVHELVQTFVQTDRFKPRTQPQMKRVAQNDLRLHGFKLIRAHRLDGTVRADRHEDGSFDNAVVERHTPASGLTFGFEEFKFKSHFGS